VRARRTGRLLPIAVPPWVVSALLIGVLVMAVAAALLLVPEAQRPTLERPAAPGTSVSPTAPPS
jgi:hypothetical protein